MPVWRCQCWLITAASIVGNGAEHIQIVLVLLGLVLHQRFVDDHRLRPGSMPRLFCLRYTLRWLVGGR